MNDYIINKTFAEIVIGDKAQLTRTLTTEDIELFAVMCGDVNPAHLDAEYAKSDFFHEIIAPGMWGGALISSVLGTVLPGPGTIYLSQTLKFWKPVVVGDVITTSVVVTGKQDAKNIVELKCSCVNQAGKEVISGDAVVIASKDKIKVKRSQLPKVVLEEVKGSWYQKLIDLTKGLKPLITAVVNPIDEESLTGAVISAEAGLIVPILIGPAEKIRALAKELKLDISSYKLVATSTSKEAAEMAVQMVKQGKAEALMKGEIHTSIFLEPIVNKDGLRTDRRISHIFAIEVPYYPKPLFITDAAINIQPSLLDKKDIVQNAIDLFVAIGFGIPKVAIISAEEDINEKIPSTIDAASLCMMAARGQITGGKLDGPLAFDLAISKESVQVKGIHSEVAGDADIIVVPDLESGNILYKQMTYLSGAEAAGIVLGATVPIILTSRGSDEISRKASCALALLFAHNQKKSEK